jgi:hypothetical protein
MGDRVRFIKEIEIIERNIGEIEVKYWGLW